MSLLFLGAVSSRLVAKQDSRRILPRLPSQAKTSGRIITNPSDQRESPQSKNKKTTLKERKTSEEKQDQLRVTAEHREPTTEIKCEPQHSWSLVSTTSCRFRRLFSGSLSLAFLTHT
jgi:hypothetical protein